MKRTKSEGFISSGRAWWTPLTYAAWGNEVEDSVWLTSSDDLPKFEKNIEVVNPSDGSRWLVLDGFQHYEQPVDPEEDRFDRQRRSFWYMLRGYLVEARHAEKMFAWARRQDFSGRWMPESRNLHGVFMSEYFRSAAYAYHATPYYGYREWTINGGSRKMPADVLVTSEEYVWERGNYDCSIDQTISAHLPCAWLVREMRLQWSRSDAAFVENGGVVVAFDPSVCQAGPSTLLVRRDYLMRFLRGRGFEMLWTVLGEKEISGLSAQKSWKGRLDISGAYRTHEEQLLGGIRAKFVSPRQN